MQATNEYTAWNFGQVRCEDGYQQWLVDVLREKGYDQTHTFEDSYFNISVVIASSIEVEKRESS